MGKILFKQSNGLISVIWTQLHRKQWLRDGMPTLNVVVQTQMMLNAQIAQIQQLSQKTPKISTNLFWPIINWSCMRYLSLPPTRQDLTQGQKPEGQLKWRCPWCNGYRRRKWTRRHEFKSWTKLIAFHIAQISLGKVWIQLFSLQLWVNSRTDWVLQPWWRN